MGSHQVMGRRLKFFEQKSCLLGHMTQTGLEGGHSNLKGLNQMLTLWVKFVVSTISKVKVNSSKIN